jgi:RNA polymerase-interacting CarD/CdnL/TRCF family regulator
VTRPRLLPLLAFALWGCASTPAAIPEAPPREREGVSAWFAVKGASCDDVRPTLGVAATLREGEASPWRTADQGGYCAVATRPGQAHLRLDSVAQQSSAALKKAAIAFYVADGRWSFTVFMAGDAILYLESHVGEPELSGRSLDAARLLGVEPERLEASLGAARDLARYRDFCEGLGLAGFGADAAGHLLFLGAPEVIPGSEEPPPERTLARIPPGSWAALPPLGVVLVKSVESRTRDGVAEPTYVIVAGMSPMELPVTRAEKMGMRPIAKASEVQAWLTRLDEGYAPGAVPYDPARVKGWLDALKSGALEGIVSVYGTLCALADERRLFQVESGLQATSEEWLSAEFALALEQPPEAVEARLGALCE